MKSLQCSCGQRIVRRDVVHQSHLVRTAGPSFVYLKFRCSRCKKLGELYVPREEWSPRLLRDVQPELTASEREAFADLGSITITEVRDFHRQLDELQVMPTFISPDE